MERVVAPGRILFGVAIAALGVEHLVCAHSKEAVLPVIPWVPASPMVAYFIGAVLLAVGLSIAANFRTRPAAILVGAWFLGGMLILQVPKAAASPLDLGIRTGVFECAALCGAAWAFAASLPASGHASPRWAGILEQVLRAGRYLFAVSAVVFGISHFLIPEFIASLIPAWIPWPLFWAYLTGFAFIAAGVSIAARRLDRWSAALLGTMFLLWFVLLHVPRVLSAAKFHDPDEWSSAIIALALCGGSWLFVPAVQAGVALRRGSAVHSTPIVE